MSGKNKHMERSRRSYRNPKLPSLDKANHGYPPFLRYSDKNKNKNRMPSWEDRHGAYVKEA